MNTPQPRAALIELLLIVVLPLCVLVAGAVATSLTMQDAFAATPPAALAGGTER